MITVATPLSTLSQISFFFRPLRIFFSLLFYFHSRMSNIRVDGRGGGSERGDESSDVIKMRAIASLERVAATFDFFSSLLFWAEMKGD